MGGNFKLIYSYLGPGTGNTEDEGKTFTFAFDIGAKYRDLGVKGLDLALAIQNIGPNVTYVDESQSDPLPMTFRLGASYQTPAEESSQVLWQSSQEWLFHHP